MHTGKAVAMSVAVLVAILLTVAAPTILKELTGTPAAAATVFGTPESEQSSHSGATTGPLTLSEFSLDCYLFPGGLSHCLGPGQGGQSYPRMFFSFWFVIGPWAATLQPSKLAGTAGPATTDATRPVGNSAVSKYSKSFSVNCNLYADNTHFCFTTPPAPFSERAAGMFLQIAYEANATAAATAHEVPAREGSLFHRGLHVTSSGPGAFAAPAATNDNRQTVTSARSDRYTDDPKWIVECYVSADGTLLCLQPSGGQGTPTAHIRLDLTLAGAAMQAASDTGPRQGPKIASDPPNWDFECDVTVDGGQKCAGPPTDPKGTELAELDVAVFLTESVDADV